MTGLLFLPFNILNKIEILLIQFSCLYVRPSPISFVLTPVNIIRMPSYAIQKHFVYYWTCHTENSV